MGLFSRKPWDDEKVKSKLLYELSFASRFPDVYINSPEILSYKLDRILSKARADFQLPYEIKSEMDSVIKFISFPSTMKAITGKEEPLSTYADFVVARSEYMKRIEDEKVRSEKHREKLEKAETGKRHGMEQKTLLEKFRREGYDGKRWVSEGDFDVRASHRRVNGQIRPLDEPFDLPDGVRLMYPGDPNGPKRETDGCRCSMVPVRLSRGENGTYKKL